MAEMNAVDSPAVSAENPLRDASQLPFALPPFGDITPEHLHEALLAGMAEQRAEVAAIVDSADPATFENTVVALERSGRLLSRAEAVFGNLASSVSTPRLREIEREIAPLEAAHSDALRLDPALFARIDAVHAARHEAGLDDEAVRLVERYHLDFVLAGAQLDDAGRAPARRAEPRALDAVDDLRAEPPAGHRGRRRAGHRPRRARRPRRRGDRRHRDGRGRPGRRRLPDHPGAPDRAARAHQAAEPRPAPEGVRGIRSRGRPPASTTTGRSPSGSRGCGRSGPGCSASTPMPTWSWPTPPRAPPRRSTRCWPRWCRRRWRTPTPRRRCSPRRPPATGSRSRPGTGRSTASRCAPSATPSTPTALRPYFELDRVLVDGVFHAAELLYGYRFTAASGSARLPPRRPGVGGRRRRRRRGGALPRRLLRPRGQAGRGVDELVRPAVAPARHPPGGGEQPQRVPGAGRPADAADPRRGQHAVPRVRARAARAELRGHLSRASPAPACRATSSSSPARSTRCGRSGRRCSATTPGTWRRGSRCRPPSSRRSTPRSCGARASARSSTSPRRCSTRPGTGSRPETEVGDPIAFEQQALEAAGVASDARAAALPDDVLPAHLRRGLRGRVLLLHLVGGPRRRHRGVVQGERRPAPGERRRLPQPAALGRRFGRPAGRVPRRPRPRRRPRPAAPPPRSRRRREPEPPAP